MPHAQVIRIEEQLTVPSRRGQQLADVWISLKWNSLSPDWIAAFAELARPYGETLSPEGVFEVVPLSAEQGWIASRGVDLARVQRSGLEVLVRRLVAEANERIEAPQAVPLQRSEPRYMLGGVLPNRFSTALRDWIGRRSGEGADVAASTSSRTLRALESTPSAE